MSSQDLLQSKKIPCPVTLNRVSVSKISTFSYFVVSDVPLTLCSLMSARASSRPSWSSSRDENVNWDVGSSGFPVGGSSSSCLSGSRSSTMCLHSFGFEFSREPGVTNQKLASGFGHVCFDACRGGNSEECRNSTCQNDSSLFLCPFIW